MGRDTTSESDSDLSTISRTKHDISELSDASWSEPNRKKAKKKIRSKHKCSYEGCEKVFNRPWKLDAHLKLHKNERPFTCDVPGCGKAYTNTSHLKRHTRASHTEKVLDKSSIRCSEVGCEKVFKTRQFLARHLRRAHSEFPFVCAVVGCGKSFKRNRHLKEHSFAHTAVHPYRCETCDRGFEKLYDLKRHARGHRTFTCSIGKCSETFENASLYRKHLAAMHNEDYVCPVCKKRFSTVGNRNAHLLCHASSATAQWPCSHPGCSAVFAQERYMRQHAAHAHDDTRTFVCNSPNCGRLFYWKRNLVHHYKVEHSGVRRAAKPKKRPAARRDKGVPRESQASVMAALPLTAHGHSLLVDKEDFTTDSELGEVIWSEHVKDVLSPVKPQEEDGSKSSSTTANETVCIL